MKKILVMFILILMITGCTNSTKKSEDNPNSLDNMILSYGNDSMQSYVVGEDFPAGKYIISHKNGKGNLMIYDNNVDYTILFNEIINSDTSNFEFNFQDGNLIEIYKDLIINVELK